MKVYGALESAQAEWFTNAGKPAASTYPYRMIYVTDLRQMQVSDGTQWRIIGSSLDTYTSGTIPAAASNANGIIWVSDLQQVQISNGTAWIQVGSKAGTKNYFSQNNANADFETNSVSPWSACTLTFSSGVPSGAPTLTATQMAIATTATTPLSGTYSMELTKSAANAQYQGFISGALTIDREDTAKVLYGSFYYEVMSGTIDLSGSSTQSLEIWIYNTVSGQWTQPAGYRGMNQSSGVGKVVFSFQTDGTYANNAYKIAVITQQTGTSAYVVKFDDFQVGPQAVVLGNAMTDPVSYTPILSNAGNATATGSWYRLGSNVVIEATITIGSTLPTGTITISKPSNITPSMATTGLVNTAIVTGSIAASGATYDGALRYDISLGTFSFLGGNGQQFWNATVPATWAAGDKIRISATMQVTGWGSFSQISSDTDTRVIAASFSKNATQSIPTNSITKVVYQTVSKDTAGAWDSTNNRYYAPVSGFYSVSAVQQFASGVQDARIAVVINGVLDKYIGRLNIAAGAADLNGTGIIYCNAGDYVEIHSFQNSGAAVNLTATASSNHFEIYRLSGPSVITATETVACEYVSTAVGSTLTTSTSLFVDFPTKQGDTHNAVLGAGGGINATATNTWRFVAPISGRYSVSYGVSFTIPATSNTDYAGMICVDGVGVRQTVRNNYATVNTSGVTIGGSAQLQLTAGQYVSIRIYQSSGANRTLTTNASENWVTVVRVGN